MQLTSGVSLPTSEDHPFWMALAELSDAISSNFEQRRVTVERNLDRVEHGCEPTISSDAPDWAHLMRMDLPADSVRRQEIIGLVLTHCSRARRALPDATWKVTIGERAFQWDPIEGFKQP